MNLHAPVILLRSEDMNYLTPSLDFNKRIPSDYYLFDLCQRGESLGRNIQVSKTPHDKHNIEMAKYRRDETNNNEPKSQFAKYSNFSKFSNFSNFSKISKLQAESEEPVDKIRNLLNEQYPFPLSKKKYDIFMAEKRSQDSESCKVLNKAQSNEEPLDLNFNMAVAKSTKYLQSLNSIKMRKDLRDAVQKKPTIIYYGDTRPLSKRVLTKYETPQHNIQIYTRSESEKNDKIIQPVKSIPYEDVYLDWNRFINFIYNANLINEQTKSKAMFGNFGKNWSPLKLKPQTVQNNISKCNTITKLLRQSQKVNSEKEYLTPSSSNRKNDSNVSKEIEDLIRIKEKSDQNWQQFKKYTSEVNLKAHLQSPGWVQEQTGSHRQLFKHVNDENEKKSFTNYKAFKEKEKEKEKSNTSKLNISKIIALSEKNINFEVDDTIDSNEKVNNSLYNTEKATKENKSETPKTSVEMNLYLKRLSKYNKRFMFQKYNVNANTNTKNFNNNINNINNIATVKSGLNIYAHNTRPLQNLLSAENFSKKLFLENQSYKYEILDRIEEENVKACVKYGNKYVKAKMKEFHNITKENSKEIMKECQSFLKENNFKDLAKISKNFINLRRYVLLSERADREKPTKTKASSGNSFLSLSRLDKFISKNFYSKWKQMKLLKLR